MEVTAKSVGVIGFKGLYQDYVKSLKSIASPDAENVSQFSDQPLELDTGEWKSDESGVWKYAPQGGIETACPHPIMPVERLRNIDTGELKVKLAFRRGTKSKKVWSTITTDFDTVSNSKNITTLSRIGISVTSGKRAQNLVDYIADVLDKNYDLIPEYKSTSRMGWNEEGFSPYVDEVVFDGNPGFEKLFQSIRQHGKFQTWLDEAISVRKYSVTAKIVMAASFGSALVGPCGILPFFVHLWGMDSGTGKTVAQMVAASVWANPVAGGDYFKTFKSTSVGFEVIAGFLNSLPVVIDELQLAKDARGKVIFNVYELASGSGKLRSNKTLGLASSVTWANCFITSGETPLTSENDGAGAINRVIEIECKAENKVIENGHKTAGIVKENYGFAGMLLVQLLSDPNTMDEAKKLYEEYYTECMKNDTTEKQAMAAAVIIVADTLATKWIFKDGQALTVKDMSEFLKSKESVSAADRGYQYMCDWVAQNSGKMHGSSDNEVFGRIVEEGTDKGYAYIIRSVWDKACSDAQISSRALLSHLRTRGLIKTSGKGFTKSSRIGSAPANCVVLKLPPDPNDNDQSWINQEIIDDWIP
ncbi:DUF927 domain-containing protein [Caproiciproducens faecalis]|uniref:DUF927 domain-containing protein n=1 Tax=Caproiciproducens faecalis TaxID=2820301 RepID=A0ABS7DRG9_9FIRM|nr:DUF927 domain-containing protein [Caproiciproducens faecalis]MBW7573892.1 DUF927 domain-containing protein [Caproiciproducens faecalis]